MTIHTLRHIHDLLIEDEAKKRRMKNWANEARTAAEEEGDKRRMAEAHEQYEKIYNVHRVALSALDDFENHEF